MTVELCRGAGARNAPMRTCHLGAWQLARGAGGERGMTVIASGSTVEKTSGRPGGRQRDQQG